MLVITAVNFSAIKHKNQKRKGIEQTPYINHPIGVAYNLTSIGQIDDPVTIAAALLHDTLEDTDTTYQELVDTFGVEVARVVLELSDDQSLSREDRKKGQVIKAAKFSERAKLVKLADKLYNLNDLKNDPIPGHSVERIQGYFKWCKAVIDLCRGVSPALEAAIDQLYSSTFEIDGVSYPTYVKTLEDKHMYQE